MDKFKIPPAQSTTSAAEQLALFYGVKNVQIINAKKDNPYSGKVLQDYSPDFPIGTSSLGTPVYTDLTLMGCSWTDNYGIPRVLLNDRFRQGGAGNSQAGVGASININQGIGFYMNLETVLITVTQSIKVIKTEIQGMDGTVKEYIGKDDMRLSIKGMITGLNGQNPREEVKRLQAWLDAPVSKSIVAWWLDNLGISSIVVTSYDFPQIEGGYSYQVFSFEAISDTPVELYITQPIT